VTRRPTDQARQKGLPYYPMQVLNGYLRANPSVHAPTTGLDTSPVEFRRYVNASGAQDVQISNGLWRRTGRGLMPPIGDMVGFMYAAVPRIPGQMRDNYGGSHKHGIGPSEYQRLWQATAGSQPQNSGGSRQLLGDYIQNPGTS
jgi:hypothetical protein